MGKWVTPVDPKCSKVAKFRRELFDDPMTHAMGAPTDEICEDFDNKHRVKCKRCQEYGAANVDVEY